ncbi:MAG: hypothetical protein J7M14_02470, partial [Planctomycetes bacterium]|nr:hypothetical protein [Planctomycetota bacterium]
LLLLEGMAALCAVVTPALGSIPQIYGPSRFALDGAWNSKTVVNLIETATEFLPFERRRLVEQCRSLSFDAGSVARMFRRSLIDNS